MYKIVLFLLMLCPSMAFCTPSCCNTCWDVAVSSGYIWKSDRHFKEVYGRGIQDVITVDASYSWCRCLGLGVKGSYWHASGKTAVCKKNTKLEEVPLIFYLRGKIGCTFQGYASVGGGVIFARERSYLGSVKQTVGGLEAEVGLNYYFYRNCYLTGAFRYLWFQKKFSGLDERADFGGYGIRGGLGISF